MKMRKVHTKSDDRTQPITQVYEQTENKAGTGQSLRNQRECENNNQNPTITSLVLQSKGERKRDWKVFKETISENVQIWQI